MDTYTRNVKDIGADNRRALERVIGQDLAENQQIVIQVVDLDNSKQAPEFSNADCAAVVPDWWKIYDGLAEEEIERLDRAIRQRADLTRNTE